MIILKILLIIILSLLILIAFILLLNIHISVVYTQELYVDLRILFVKIRLMPRKKKTQKEKTHRKKTRKSGKPSKKTDKKKNGIKDVLKEKGLSGFLNMLKELLKLSSTHAIYLLSKTKVEKLEIDLSYSGEDAAQTAIGYGKCCAIVYPAAAFIAEKTICRRYSVNVTPDFSENAETTIYARLICRVKVIKIVITAIKFLTGYIKLKTNGVV